MNVLLLFIGTIVLVGLCLLGIHWLTQHVKIEIDDHGDDKE